MLVGKMLLAVAGLGSMSLLFGAAQPKPGSVFVMTNGADKNEIIAYDRAMDGSLSESGRYDTQGRGSGGGTDPLSSQGSLVLSDDNTLLFAANAGSGNVSVFRVRKGQLSFVDKAPTGGSAPVVVTQSRNLVFVLNAAGRGNVVGFHLELNGRLTRIPGSSAFLTANWTGGSSLSVSPNGEFLVVVERVANNIDVFPINLDGSLGPVVVNHSVNPGAFSAAFLSAGSLVVSETGAANAVNGSTASSYAIKPDGTLTLVGNTLPTFGAGNCWNVMTPDGKWVYFDNSASSSISGFGVGKGGVLTPISATVLATKPAGTTNLDMAVSSDGKYLYTLNSGSGNLSGFAVQSDGSLLPIGDFGSLAKSAGFNGLAAY